MSFAPNPNNGRRGGAAAGTAAGSTTRSTVQYGAAARSRGLGGGAPTFASAHSTKGTVVAHPTSKQVVGDRGQALVSIARWECQLNHALAAFFRYGLSTDFR